MKKILFVFYVLLVFFITACGSGGGDDNSSNDTAQNSPSDMSSSSCQVEECTNLEKSEKVTVNALPQTGTFLGGEAYGIKFDAIIGNEYKIHVVSSVKYTFFISDSDPLVPSKALFRDSEFFSGHHAYEFQAKNNGVHYAVIKLGESTQKVEASIRVTSRTENLTPLENTPAIGINDIRTPLSLMPNQTVRRVFDVKKGNTYSIYSADTKGEFVVYTSIIPSTDRYEYDDWKKSGGTITFQAKEDSKMYVAASDKGNGSDGHIRVYSYDEQIVPLGNEKVLLPNTSAQVQFDVNPLQYIRFMFNTVPGKDYTVSVTEVSGGVGAWLSKLPSVDSHVYEKRDFDCKCMISWRAAENATWYLAVGNNSKDYGAKFTVQLLEK